MARIRTIKPAHWQDKELPNISLQAHLLWIATWNFSDDKGVFEGDPLFLRAQIFPRRTDIRVEQISQWLDQLVKARYIIPFTYDGEGYYINRTFDAHQRIDKPQDSKIPSDVIKSVFKEYSKNVPRLVLPVLEGMVVDSKVLDSPGTGVPAPEQIYEQTEKTQKAISDFISANKPTFIEPYRDLWNLFAHENSMPKIKELNEKRKKKLKARAKEIAFDFPGILHKAGKSEFILSGNWFGFDWILENDSNYLKVLEGMYDSKTIRTEPGESLNDKLLSTVKNHREKHGLNKPE